MARDAHLPVEDWIARLLPGEHAARQMRHVPVAEPGQLSGRNFAHPATSAVKNDGCVAVRRQTIELVRNRIEGDEGIRGRQLALIRDVNIHQHEFLVGKTLAQLFDGEGPKGWSGAVGRSRSPATQDSQEEGQYEPIF